MVPIEECKEAVSKTGRQEGGWFVFQIKKDSEVVLLRELMRCKAPIWADLLDTLNDIIRPLKKFLSGFEVKTSSKMTVFGVQKSVISTMILGKMLSSSVFFSNKKGFWGHMATKIGALLSPDLGRPPRYLTWPPTISKKILGGFEVKTSWKNSPFWTLRVGTFDHDFGKNAK